MPGDSPTSERPAHLGPLIPFRRGKFDALPDVPWRPHRFAETRMQRVPVTTEALGACTAAVRTLRARKAAGERFPIPLLLLYAERDPMVPPRFGDVFASLIPDARLVRLPDASHFAHVDAADRFVPPVLDFLRAG